MAYVSGSVNSLADLLSALQSACTSNGWTLSGNVLHKGAVYVRLSVSGSLLLVRGGTGIDGSNNLIGVSSLASDAALGQALTDIALSWPATYEIHVHTDPDEVYCILQYGITHYQWIAFGRSAVAGLAGTGNWYGASSHLGGNRPAAIAGGSAGSNTWGTSAKLFWNEPNYDAYGNSGLDHGYAGISWREAFTYGAMSTLISRQPNTWNGETALLPLQAYLSVGSAKVALVADLMHARHVRIDNLDPGSTIALGEDRWKIYPWFAKDASDRNQATGNKSTGTYGWAIRYDGP